MTLRLGPLRPRATRRRALGAAFAAALLPLAAMAPATPAGAVADGSNNAAGGEVFKAGAPYSGSFPDPAIIKVGSTYVAYATTAASKTLPVMTSTDMRTWRPRASYDPKDLWDNDGMPHPASWAQRRVTNRSFVPSWAPSAAQLPNKTFLVAYAPPLRSGKRCISVATAKYAVGPYTDVSKGPIVCPSNQGAIDPHVYVAGNRAWLLWKTEGRPGAEPTKMYSRELDTNLAPRGQVKFRAGSATKLLLATSLPWEGNIIENPAMFTYQGRTYLFYSANQWITSKYAIGYARCAGPAGPCTKASKTPLLASGADVAGPGGPAPYVGPGGELGLGYAAYRPDAVGGGQTRRLYLAKLAVNADGSLKVASRVYQPGS